MASQVVLISTNKDMFDERRVVVEAIHTLEYTKYVEANKKLTGIFKLMNKDFSELEKRYDIPEGTIESDISTVNMMSVRQRFVSGGEMLLIHYGDDHEGMTFDEYEHYFNTMPVDKLKKFIADAKLH